jgi:hypothetical protein
VNFFLAENGFEFIRAVLNPSDIDGLRNSLATLAIAPGHRNLAARVPLVTQLASSSSILKLVQRGSSGKPVLVRSILFDKTAEINWLVPWHQDLSIAVKERRDIPRYGPWSLKDGIPHVQPPTEILQSIITLRLHLDDCDETNGALRVVPRSHDLGRIDSSQFRKLRQIEGEVVCSMMAGDALLMRPLLLHSSSPALVPCRRRVIHLEFSSCSLEGGLEWAV